ncbi:hypothetical protein CGCSCA1_v014553 [Colletotrichum siamense]|nr:hypothetical protein CGCSCA1_v014553 [Colletotrichum siamense]
MSTHEYVHRQRWIVKIPDRFVTPPQILTDIADIDTPACGFWWADNNPPLCVLSFGAICVGYSIPLHE